MPFESEAQRRFMYSQHPKLAKEFESATPEGADLPEHKHKKMADGGVVHDMENPTEQDKTNEIYNAMGMGKFAVGGLVPPPAADPQLAIPDRNDPNFWESIKNALTKVGGPITKPIAMAQNVAEAATPVIQDVGRQMAPPAVAAVNELTRADFPIPEAPKTPDLGTPTPLSQPVPPPAPKTPAPAPSVPGTKTGITGDQPKLDKLFDQDTSKLTEGYNPEDRKVVAANMAEKQGGIGSIIAEALAGLGDALAAKGGKDQHALHTIFNMQKQQRDEALANFDKERQGRLETLDLKTKMGDNAIKQLAAQDAYGSDENLNRQLGAPAGTKHKDLPLYFQMAAAKAQASEKDADLRMRAAKQAADDVESAVKNASMFSFKPSAEQIKAQGAKLADQYFHKAKGNILFKPSDGQPAIWIPAANLGKAQQMDPNGKVVQ